MPNFNISQVKQECIDTLLYGTTLGLKTALIRMDSYDSINDKFNNVIKHSNTSDLNVYSLYCIKTKPSLINLNYIKLTNTFESNRMTFVNNNFNSINKLNKIEKHIDELNDLKYNDWDLHRLDNATGGLTDTKYAIVSTNNMAYLFSFSNGDCFLISNNIILNNKEQLIDNLTSLLVELKKLEA